MIKSKRNEQTETDLWVGQVMKSASTHLKIIRINVFKEAVILEIIARNQTRILDLKNIITKIGLVTTNYLEL